MRNLVAAGSMMYNSGDIIETTDPKRVTDFYLFIFHFSVDGNFGPERFLFKLLWA